MSDDLVRAEVQAWFTARVPATWFTGPVDVVVDRDEIQVLGRLAAPTLPAGASDEACGMAMASVVKAFREATRDDRIRIAEEAEHRFGRTVSWGVATDEGVVAFTTASVPVMTRLRMPERQVLDTLIDTGIARSRSEALAWCVRLVGTHADEWLHELRDALRRVADVRARGPQP